IRVDRILIDDLLDRVAKNTLGEEHPLLADGGAAKCDLADLNTVGSAHAELVSPLAQEIDGIEDGRVIGKIEGRSGTSDYGSDGHLGRIGHQHEDRPDLC